MLRCVLCAVLVVFCCSCAPEAKKEALEQPGAEQTVNADTDSLMHEAVFALPEVRERAAYIDSVTKGERKLIVWTSAEPTAEEPAYSIHAGEDNGGNLVTHFHFLVTPGTPPLVRVYDPVLDTVLTLEEWREGAQHVAE
jgi:hypothetical protein